MILRQFLHSDPVAASYLFGCGGKASCAVVDPIGDIAPYIEAAAATGMKILYVIDTHIHADHLSSGQALAFGPGHLDGTPAAGEAGTAVYAAHRDTHFAFLGDVGIGDRIEVERHDGVVALFRVTGRAVVDWDAPGIDVAAPGRHLVLATCWPLDARTAGPERLVVHAEAVGPAAHASSSPGR